DMFTSKGFWNRSYRKAYNEKVSSGGKAAEIRSNNAAAEVGWGRPDSASSIRYVAGNGAASEVQSARALSDISRQSDEVLKNAFQQNQVYQVKPVFNGAYDLNLQVTQSIKRRTTDELSSNGSVKPTGITMFQSFLMDQIEAMTKVR
ncbi:MAG: hypothetical protein WCK20_01870, partial [Thermoleophilia bacterium]